jgi:iron(III) transport system substrate-binding protein
MREIILIFITLLFVSCSNTPKESITIYVSEDQVFSEPILKDFEKDTGIKINAVYDSEESKSTGVMNRLIAEKNSPQADVYWANEPIRAEVLKNRGILAKYNSPNAKGIAEVFREKDNYWCGFSARVRLLIINKKLKDRPKSILAYRDSSFRSKAVIANPLFGSTTAHIAALFTILGDQKAKAFMNDMKRNEVAISTSNGESADFVASNSYSFSLVDSDDAMSRIKQKESVVIEYPDQEDNEIGAFVIPNVVMLIKNSPHPKLAKKLIDYLLSKESEKKLAFADCAQIPLHKGVELPKGLKPINQIKVMKVNYEKVAKKLVEIQPFLKEWVSK